MSELPPGWAEATVGELAASAFDGPFGSNLKTADYVPSGVRVVRLENIGRLRFISEKQTYIAEGKYEALRRHTLAPNDVLFSSFIEDRTRVCLFPEEEAAPAINKADCFCIRVNASVCEPRLLVLALATDEAHRQLSGEIHGATRPRIGLRDLLALPLGLPPLAEQRRIVAKIDALTARSKRARAELRRTLDLLEKARAGVLTELTVGASAGIAMPLAKVGRWGSGGTPKSGMASFYDGEIPWIRSGDLPDGPIREHAVTISEAGHAASSAKWVPTGAVLVAMYGATIGRVGLTTYPVTTNQAVAFCIPVEDVHADFLFCLLRALRPVFVAAGQGGAQPNISQQLIKATVVRVPSLLEQRAIVARIETAFAALDRVEAEAKAAERALDRLDQAILAKAFRGELVPQDPADEPASALLARIAAERAATPKTARGRRRTAA